jgi:predicted branched-subunit amino acid permease
MNFSVGLSRAANDNRKIGSMLVGVTALVWASWMIFAVAWLAMGIAQAALNYDPSVSGLDDVLARTGPLQAILNG